MNIKSDILSYLRLTPSISTADWIETHIDLTALVSSAKDGMVKLDPYQRPVFDSLDLPTVRQVTVMAPEQTAKSVCWQWYLLRRLATDGTTALIVYQSEDIASTINRDVLDPLLGTIPTLATDLARPFAKKKDSYHFSSSIVYFLGAGAPIISRPAEVVIADEIDFWQAIGTDTEESTSDRVLKTADNFRNLVKRTMTYRDTSKVVVVCSPTLPGQPVHREFRKGTQSYWHIKCLDCGTYHRSHDLRLLQWETTVEKSVVADSIRYTCPKCKLILTEDRAQELNNDGTYIAETPDIKHHHSFQWGALASPRTRTWLQIAEAQQEAGTTGSRQAKLFLANSIKGLVYWGEKEQNQQKTESFSKRLKAVAPKDFSFSLFSADTQDTGYYWIHRGYIETGDSYLIDCGFAPTIDALKDIVAKTKWWLGIIDEGGHRAEKDLRPWVKTVPRLYTYKGSTQTKQIKHGGKNWQQSEENARLILANPYHYQSELLYLLHSKDLADNGGRFYITEKASDEYISQILALKPNNRKVNDGDHYHNWTSDTRPDHFFDAEKMALVLLDFAPELPKQIWPDMTIPKFIMSEMKKRIIEKVKKV
jgi:hypothetical protein